MMTADQLEVAALFAHERATDVAINSEWHGPEHWRDVARLGWKVTRDLPFDADDMAVIFLFAALHDTQRHNDYEDPDHGRRAVELARDMVNRGLIELPEESLQTLYAALAFHNGGSNAGTDFVMGACWDADRLTLYRVGIMPTEEYMTLPHVKLHFDSWRTEGNNQLLKMDVKWRTLAADYLDIPSPSL